jgi:hypothetical protein
MMTEDCAMVYRGQDGPDCYSSEPKSSHYFSLVTLFCSVLLDRVA